MQSSNEDEKKELIDLNIKIGQAEKDGKVSYLEQVLSDDLRFRRASGAIVTKKEYLEDLKKPENTYEYIILEDVKPTVYEGIAVVTLRVRAKGTRGNKNFEGIYRNIRLFLRSNGWQCVMWFNVEIQDSK